MRHFIKIWFIVITVIGSSCEDFLEENPKTLLSESSSFSTFDGANNVMIGAYHYIKGGHTPLINLVCNWSDMIQGRGSWAPNSDWADPLNSTNISRSNGAWTACYKSINICNRLLVEVPELTADQQSKNELMGEARFLRALCYHYLVRLYGPVPVRTEPISTPGGAEKGVPRSSVEEVYNQVVVPDLEFAETHCVESWDGQNMGRATRWAAKGLLAEVHLTLENWGKARDLAEEVITNGGFSLVQVNAAADFSQIYGAEIVKHSEEIFAFKYSHSVDDIGNWMMNLYNGENGGLYTPSSSGWRALMVNITSPLVTSWSDQDLRKVFSVTDTMIIDGDTLDVTHESRGVKFPCITKFRDNEAVDWNGGGNDVQVLRLPDMLLIYAEAAAMANGGAPTALAVERLNMVKRRAYGYDPASASPVDYPGVGSYIGTFRDSVLKERAYEFFAESKRWYDLKRTDQVEEWIEKSFPMEFNDVRLLSPIPPEEIQNNPALTQDDQNTGY